MVQTSVLAGMVSLLVGVAISFLNNSQAQMRRISEKQQSSSAIRTLQLSISTRTSCSKVIGTNQTFDASQARTTNGSAIRLNGELEEIQGFFTGATVRTNVIADGSTWYVTTLNTRERNADQAAPTERRGLAIVHLRVDAVGKILECEGHPPISTTVFRAICDSMNGTFTERTDGSIPTCSAFVSLSGSGPPERTGSDGVGGN